MFNWDSVVGDDAKEVVYTLTLVEQFLCNNYEEEDASEQI